MESVQNNQVEYTEQERELAEQYKVEPKTVRLIRQIQQTEQEPEADELQEQPTAEEVVKAIDEWIGIYTPKGQIEALTFLSRVSQGSTDWYFDNYRKLAELLIALPEKDREYVLESMKAAPRQMQARFDDIEKERDDVIDFFEGLDTKSKFYMLLASQLDSLEGISNISFDICNEFRGQSDMVVSEFRANTRATDKKSKWLLQLYDKAEFILNHN